MNWATKLWWRVVFWWKKRTGFIDLHEVIEITGTVVGEQEPDLDLDQNFAVAPDPIYKWCITCFGGRLCQANGVGPPSINCEITAWAPPELRAKFKLIKIGSRVRVKGSWGFDGVHVGTYPEWIQVILAVFRHQPDVLRGWFEIHPVTELEILDV